MLTLRKRLTTLSQFTHLANIPQRGTAMRRLRDHRGQHKGTYLSWRMPAGDPTSVYKLGTQSVGHLRGPWGGVGASKVGVNHPMPEGE